MVPRFESLVDLLRWRATEHPERALYSFVLDGERELGRLTYADADQKARAISAKLLEFARPGDRALLLYPSSLDYPVAFLACLYANIVAVPAYPPDPTKPTQSLPRINRIVSDCAPSLILTTADNLEFAEQARISAADPSQIHCINTETIADEQAHAWTRPQHRHDAAPLAFLQYTSGSTGLPKGVMISHRNLIEHQRLAHRVFQCGESDVTVSWLPFYHDMGLIGSLLYPLYSGGHSVLMSPMSFLRRPMNWLHTISRYGAGVSTGPNFAYDLCVDRCRDEDLETLVLDPWRLTVCGAEPLRSDTLQRFADKFRPAGFRAKAFLPCYGMAEATLMVTGGHVEDLPKVHHFCPRALRRNRALELDAPTKNSLPVVACGWPMDEHEILIVDPRSERPLPPGVVGEIWLRGPSVGQGYWNQSERSRAIFQATPIASDRSQQGIPFFRTQDLGFVHNGELYVCGRLQDAFTVGSHTHHPHLIERDVELAEPVGLVGSVICFLPRSDTQTPVVLLEVRRTVDREELQAQCEKLSTELSRRHELSRLRVIAIAPRQIPKTTSGKIRRHAYREAYESGELEALWSPALAAPARCASTRDCVRAET